MYKLILKIEKSYNYNIKNYENEKMLATFRIEKRLLFKIYRANQKLAVYCGNYI